MNIQPRATRYTIGRNNDTTGERPLEVEETDAEQDLWAIRQGVMVLNHESKWEYEPSPSNRDEAFFDRCRWIREEAIAAAIEAYQTKNLP